MKKRDLPEIPRDLERKLKEKNKPKEAEVIKEKFDREPSAVKSWFIRNIWMVFAAGFIGIPPLVRWLFNTLIPNAAANYWNLSGLGQASLIETETSRMFAENYARVSFHVTFLVFLALLLVAIIILDRVDVKSWGLHFKNILPGILFFAGFWVIIYYFFVPVGSILSGGESYYIGLPPPPGLTETGANSSASFFYTLKYMFFPRSVVAFVVNDGTIPIYGAASPALGILDFFRVWILNGPVLMFSTLGYMFNKMMSWFDAPDWITDTKKRLTFKYVVATLFSIILVPIMTSAYKLADAALSYTEIQVEGAQIAETIYRVATANVVWTILFWLIVAIFFNFAFNWGYVKRIKRELSDWESSLYKWLPGFIVFAVGIIFAVSTGWHLAAINPTTGESTAHFFGPFSGVNVLSFFFLLTCAYTYIKTKNIFIPALIYPSLPYFLNFIRVTKDVIPTLWGSFIAAILTIIILLAYTETYRFWAPYVTFDLKFEEVPEGSGEVIETTPEE